MFLKLRKKMFKGFYQRMAGIDPRKLSDEGFAVLIAIRETLTEEERLEIEDTLTLAWRK